jgi:hypothetical protein
MVCVHGKATVAIAFIVNVGSRGTPVWLVLSMMKMEHLIGMADDCEEFQIDIARHVKHSCHLLPFATRLRPDFCDSLLQ